MGEVCEICRASSETLLEFNRLLACAACFKDRIQSIAGGVKKR